jgi:hypothetical protein
MVKYRPMKKTQAIELLGGTIRAAAEAMGVTYQAVDKWPDVLPLRIADRVLGAHTRLQLRAASEQATDTESQANTERVA